MRTPLFIPPGSRNDQINSRSDCAGKRTQSSLAGMVLASRYKILESIAGDSFKAHDLALDQTVIVRQAMRTCQCEGEIWRRRIQQLALMRDPNFLNVLGVVFDKREFVITEHPRGQSLADLLRERSRFDLEDVLRLVIPLADALDLAVALTCCVSRISPGWLFTETRRTLAVDPEQPQLSEGPPFFVKLDVWELVKHTKHITWRISFGNRKVGGLKGLAVSQAALLTYELLGGEKKTGGEVKRWFKPVNGVGEAINAILYRGLQGSPRYETGKSFFQKLESAIRSGEAKPSALPAPALQIREHSVALPGTSEVIDRFNRDTVRFATIVLGALVFAVLVLAVFVRDPYPKAADISGVMGLNRKRFIGEILSEHATNGDYRLNVISQNENPFRPMEMPAFIPTSLLAFNPEINLTHVQTSARPWAPAHWQDAERIARPKIPNVRYRSPLRLRTVDVKMRLIALWHQSLMRSKKSRSWAIISNRNRGERKKVAYTAGTEP